MLEKFACASSDCLGLFQTTDGGSTWVRVTVPPLPHEGSDVITFVDSEDGWAYEPEDFANDELFATHDGGRTWAPVALGISTDGVQAMEANDGQVWAVVRMQTMPGLDIFGSGDQEDGWTAAPLTLPLGAGPVPETSMVLEDGDGWIVENDREVIGAAMLENGTWTDWSTPCNAQEGYGIATLAGSSNQLFVLCATNEFTSVEAPPALFVSTIGGTTFNLVRSLLPPSTLGFVASPGGSLFCFDTQGIAASFDGGSTWQTVLGLATPPAGWATSVPQLDFPASTVGYTTTPAGNLVKTVDGGHSWSTVGIPNE